MTPPPPPPAPPTPYKWADWSPVGPDELTGHGYRMMRRMGEFYRDRQSLEGLPIAPADCAKKLYVYADVPPRPPEPPPSKPPPPVPNPAQRTLGTAHALIEGICGSPDAVPIFHAFKMDRKDPIFDASGYLKVDPNASRAAVGDVVGTSPWAAVTLHPGDFYAFQALLDQRCETAPCVPLASKYKESVVANEDGKLAALKGPVATASNAGENIFLEFAQCRPENAIAKLDGGQIRSALAAGMRLHVLAYDANSRSRYNSLVRGETLLAHIAAMFDRKVGRNRLDQVGAPTAQELADKTLVIFSGHDTQLGALGGILDAHWNPGGGIMPDDMPPGSALIFDLIKVPNDYLVRVHFVSRRLREFRDETQFRGAQTPVGFTGPPKPVCRPNGVCDMRLEDLESQVLGHMHAIGDPKNFVFRGWEASSEHSDQDPGSKLKDPRWTEEKCRGQ